MQVLGGTILEGFVFEMWSGSGLAGLGLRVKGLGFRD